MTSTLGIIPTTVAGIPCEVHITAWERYRPQTFHCPAEGGFGEWHICTRRGRPAPWLERKLTELERYRIEELVFDSMEER